MGKEHNKPAEDSYVIVADFRDKSNFSIEYKAGEPAEFEGDRLAELIEKGLVAAK